ncbi:MAG TPA: GNAT family N-acetyltransferase [Streptosporangiaceae bacterium]
MIARSAAPSADHTDPGNPAAAIQARRRGPDGAGSGRYRTARAGSRRAPALEQDRYFLQLAGRFPDDRPLMLVAELDGWPIGAGFALRKGWSPQCRTATLRNVAVLPPHDGIGLERRLIERIEEGAAGLGVTGIILGGPRGAERQFFLSMGYRGRREGGFMGKQLPPTVQQRSPGWRQRLEDLRSRQQSRLTVRQRPA